MSYLFILLSFLFITHKTDPDPKGLSISVTGEVELPADQIQFNINVNAEAETPQAAYNLQKKREKALVGLLDKYGIKEKNIRYEPISIRKQRINQGSDKYDTTYVTQQSVNLTLGNFDVFDEMQVNLIEHNFDNFNAHFTSSKMEKGKDKALKEAINRAKEKAQLIAQQTGVELSSVQQISYGSNYSPTPRPSYKFQLNEAASSDSMLKYDQTVTVSASITLHYAISDNS